MKYLQQGDVLLKLVESFPEGEITHDELTKNRTLALGEATGHHHTLDKVDGVEVMKIMGQLYAIIAKETYLRHQEHNPILVPPGKYKIDIVRETDHLAGIVRKVAD